MRYQEYRKDAWRTMPGGLTRRARRDYLAMKLVEEAAEVTAIVSKAHYQGEELKIGRMLEELGDVWWALVNNLTEHGLTIHDLQVFNVHKRARRFPKDERGMRMALFDRDLFRKVEHELYNYHRNVRKLRERQEEIVYSTPYRQEGRSQGRVSDPTALRGIRLARLEDSEQAMWVNCIHDALKLMPDEYRRLTKCKYFDRMQVEQITGRLHIGRTLYFAWRENVVMFVIVFATQRGLVEPICEKRVS